MYDEADEDYQGFWAKPGGASCSTGRTEWDTICEWELPFAKWFVGGQLNVADNCLDRHVAAGQGDKVAIHFEGEPGDSRTITYAELLDEVQRFANALKGLGVGKGDRVNIYLPMIPEAAVAMLACARIGAAHSVVFGGFSVAGAGRPHQRRRGQGADHRRRRLPPRRGVPAQAGRRRGRGRRRRRIEHVVVVRRGGNDVDDGRRSRPLVPRPGRRPPTPTCPAEPMDAEQLLFLLYTSGTTGKPKGIMHTTGGYLTQVAFTHKYVFDLHPDDRRVLVHRRRRLGHRPQLHRLRPARQRGDAA